MIKILVVEDDSSVASILVRSLNEQGYETTLATDGNMGLEMLTDNVFNLVILDIMLPGINGLDLCKKIRSSNMNIPVLMLTALGSTQNVVTGLDSGADDYLVKPFKLEELLARVRSMVRREQHTPVSNDEEYHSFQDLQLNTKEKVAVRGNKKITLTATEYRLLEYLLKNKKRVLSRMEILENVWGVEFNMNTKVVDVYVNYLRKKVDADFPDKLIHTAVGMGYILKQE